MKPRLKNHYMKELLRLEMAKEKLAKHFQMTEDKSISNHKDHKAINKIKKIAAKLKKYKKLTK